MRVKVDEDLPQAVVELQRQEGHDAVDVLEQRMGGWKDSALWPAVQSEGRFLITADKGFGDIRVYPPGTHHGILLLRPAGDGINAFLDLLTRVIESADLAQLTGTVSVASAQGLRIRRGG